MLFVCDSRSCHFDEDVRNRSLEILTTRRNFVLQKVMKMREDLYHFFSITLGPRSVSL